MMDRERPDADGESLDTEFVGMVDKMGPRAVAAALGAGESTVYAQADKIRKGEGSLSGKVLRKFLEYERRVQALAAPEDRPEQGGADWRPQPPERRRRRTPEERTDGKPVDWGSVAITEERRRLRVAADRHAGLIDHGAVGNRGRVGRLGGVVPDHPYDDEGAFFGPEAAELLQTRGHLQRLVEQACRSNRLLTPYEGSVCEQIRLRAQIGLKGIECILIDDHGLTLPPHTAPYDDMQRLDAIETLSSDIQAFEVARSRERRAQTALDWLLGCVWWPLRAWPRPADSGRRRRGQGATEVLRYVDSRAYAVASRYPSYEELVEDLPHQREYMDFLLRCPMPSRWFRPYERFLHDLMLIETRIELLLVEYSVVRPRATSTPRLHKTDDPAVLTGVVAEIYELMLRVEYMRGLKFVVNILLFAPWWIVRPLTLLLPSFERKRV